MSLPSIWPHLGLRNVLRITCGYDIAFAGTTWYEFVFDDRKLKGPIIGFTLMSQIAGLTRGAALAGRMTRVFSAAESTPSEVRSEEGCRLGSNLAQGRNASSYDNHVGLRCVPNQECGGIPCSRINTLPIVDIEAKVTYM